jgi:hypothetical protein
MCLSAIKRNPSEYTDAVHSGSGCVHTLTDTPHVMYKGFLGHLGIVWRLSECIADTDQYSTVFAVASWHYWLAEKGSCGAISN